MAEYEFVDMLSSEVDPLRVAAATGLPIGPPHADASFASIRQVDLGEYREWLAAVGRPVTLPAGIDTLLVGHWYVAAAADDAEVAESRLAYDPPVEEFRLAMLRTWGLVTETGCVPLPWLTKAQLRRALAGVLWLLQGETAAAWDPEGSATACRDFCVRLDTDSAAVRIWQIRSWLGQFGLCPPPPADEAPLTGPAAAELVARAQRVWADDDLYVSDSAAVYQTDGGGAWVAAEVWLTDEDEDENEDESAGEE